MTVRDPLIAYFLVMVFGCGSFASQPALAQSAQQERILRSLKSKPPQRWTDEDSRLFVRVLAELMAEGIAEYLSPSERARLGEIEVEVGRFDDSASASMVGRKLRVQEEYFSRTLDLSMLLAHDLHIDYLGPLPNPEPVQATPQSGSLLIPNLRPIHLWAGAMAGQPCPPTLSGCQALIPPTVGATFGFVIAHELSHRLLGHHSRGKDYPLEQEIAADRSAARLLARLLDDLPYDDPDLIDAADHAFAAGPLLVLESEREALATVIDERRRKPHLEAVLEARRNAYAESMAEGRREMALNSVLAESETGNAGRLEILWHEEPELLVIDGLEVSPNDVRGRQLRVSGGQHWVFALRENEIAFDRELIVDAEGDRIRLVFKPLLRRASRSELRRLERDREWLELLRRTSNRRLEPTSADVASFHYKAMRRLCFGAWIDPRGWGYLRGRELRSARRLYERSQPLADWLRDSH